MAWYESRQGEPPFYSRGVLGVGARADRTRPTYRSRETSFRDTGDGAGHPDMAGRHKREGSGQEVLCTPHDRLQTND